MKNVRNSKNNNRPNIKERLKLTTLGFTLVELLAVIVILAIILVIAVPKVINVITDSKKATLESTAKMIASSAEKAKVQNDLLGNTEEITCESVAKINNVDYSSCKVEFEGNTAKVTIEGSGKFDGLSVCEGTKTSAIAQDTSCGPKIKSIEVEQQLFLAGQTLTPDKFKVSATYSDGNTIRLWGGGLKVDETAEPTTITSPNWPENYPVGMTESENYWEVSYEGSDAIQITFDETSETAISRGGEDYIRIYGKGGNPVQSLFSTRMAGKTYVINGDYVKITMESNFGGEKGFSATIKPVKTVEPEYTVSPNVVPEGDFDITISVNGQNIRKKINAKSEHYADDYVVSRSGIDTVQTYATIDGEEVDAGVRYVGSNPNNKVYFNCKDKDSLSVSYGENNYDHASSCEVWRIIGAFDVDNGKGNIEKRVKIIRDEFPISMSWDSSNGTFGYSETGSIACSGVNCGYGINQWGESTYSDGTLYEGADLMRMLNGYYIGESSTCTYCSEGSNGICSNDCSSSVTPLSSISLNMIDDALWYTGSPTYNTTLPLSTMYAGERSTQSGKICTSGTYCNDNVVRKATWVGKIGLIYPSDYGYASTDESCANSIGTSSLCDKNNWLHPSSESVGRGYLTISPAPSPSATFACYAFSVDVSKHVDIGRTSGVRPTLYLSSNVKIIGGNGDTEPYKLAI